MKFGDVKLGTQLINPDGTYCRSIGIFPQGVKDTYKFTFEDGATLEAGAEHLWGSIYRVGVFAVRIDHVTKSVK